MREKKGKRFRQCPEKGGGEKVHRFPVVAIKPKLEQKLSVAATRCVNYRGKENIAKSITEAKEGQKRNEEESDGGPRVVGCWKHRGRV